MSVSQHGVGGGGANVVQKTVESPLKTCVFSYQLNMWIMNNRLIIIMTSIF